MSGREPCAGQHRWLSQAAALAGVAAGSYLLGRRAALQRRPGDGECGGGGGGVRAGGRADAAAGTEASPSFRGECQKLDQEVRDGQLLSTTQELLRLFAQLPPRALGPHAGAHSAARAALVCASGKGGVGKSTVSVNLAFMLDSLGLKVGLLDLDVYGPSLPQLVRLPPGPVMQNERGRIVPLDYGGVGLMSWGYIQPDAATVRAPILNQMVSELLTSVEWGVLDILIIDSPPGTGDVLISLGQTLPVDGAILVTTSNDVSLADMIKGLQLFEKLEIPPLLVVANMASFCCEGCGRQHELFSDGAVSGLPKFTESKGIGVVKLPLDPLLSQAPQQPMPAQTREYPFVRSPAYANRAAMAAFRHLAHAALEALLGARCADGAAGPEGLRGLACVRLKLRSGGSLEVRMRSGELKPVACGPLRASCRCTLCVDELTGEVKIDRERVCADGTLRATGLTAVGNYAVNIRWSDGHSSIVALRAVERLVGGGTAAQQHPGGKEAVLW